MTTSYEPPVVWRFRTHFGSVRLVVSAPKERLGDLHAEIRGCGVVADSLDEFLSLATMAITRAGGIPGDVLTTPWPVNPLSDAIRNAASKPTREAVGVVLDGFASASDAETQTFLRSESAQSLRLYVRDLARDLDENEGRFLQDLADLMGVEVRELFESLGGQSI